MKSSLVLLAVALAGLVSKAFVSAATRTWTGNVNGNWSTGLNWSGGLPPASGDDLVFPAGAARTTVTNNFSPNRPFNSITFLAPYTVHGESLILTNGLRCGHTNATVTIHAAISIAGPQSFIVTNGPAALLHLNTNLDLGVHGLTVGGNGKVEISSTISGASGIVKNGTNVLHFYGSRTNSYLGATVVNAGTLQLNKSGGTAIAGQLIIGDGVGGQDADVVHILSEEQIADNVSIQINSSGLLYCGGSVLESIGPLTLAGGRTFAPGPTGTLILLNNVTTLASTNTARFDGRVSFASSRTFTVADGAAHPDLNITGTIIDGAGNVNLTKNGAGTLRISGVNGLTGSTIIREGFLEAAGDTSLRTTIVSNSAALRLVGVQPPIQITGFTLTLNGNGGGNGALQLTNGHAGWRGPVVLASHSTIGVFGATNTITIGGTNGQLSGSGGFTKIGDGTLRLTNSLGSTYEGYTYVHGGRLELSNAPGAVAIPDRLFVGDDDGGSNADVVRLLRGGQISQFAQVVVNSSGWLDCTPIPNGQIQTLGTLTLSDGAHVTVPSGSELHVAGTITATGEEASLIDGSGYLFLDATNAVINVTGSGESINLSITPPTPAAGTVTKTGPGRLALGPGYLATPSLRVAAGSVQTASPNALGSLVANPTVIVSNGATLFLVGGSPYPQSLILHGHGVGGTNGALRVSGANSNKVWAGSVTLASDSTVHVTGSSYVSATQLTFSNAITGPGKFIKDGGGRLNFTGNTANTYAGGTWLRDGYFDLRKPDGTAALPGNVVIGDGNGAKTPNLHHSAAEQMANTADVTFTNGSWDMSIFTETIATLNGGGGIHFGPGGKLIVSPAGLICTFQGAFTGDGELVKSGIGTLILEGAASHTGQTTVSNGVLRVNGSLTNSPIAVRGTSRLEGHGTVAAISLFDTATLSPGSSPGRLTSGPVTLADAGFFRVELQGPSPGADYDQLRVRGLVDLNTATLNASLGFSSSLSNQFVIIDNDGTDPIGGTFQGLPQNSLLSIGGEQFRISYSGGDGNDVVLTQVSGTLRPVLTIEPLPPESVRLRWPTNNSAGFILQSSTNLAATNWSAATPPTPVITGTNWVVTNTVSGPRKFYRLFRP
ncbi:MAG: beta strand repeat-containing protein [Limisphaerales bacterium]